MKKTAAAGRGGNGMIWTDVVELRALMEGDGILGDARDVLSPGESFFGLSFEDLVRARAGSVKMVDEIALIQ
jgi:hypothetical protein